jgi:cysteine-rich repeat protein
MVKRSRGWALFWALGLSGCNELAGVHEGILDPCVDAGTCGSGGQGGATGSSATDPSSASATASSGSSGGRCGDGIIDPGEECDDGNNAANDGCTACVMDCNGAGAFKDPVLHHCYRIPVTKLGFLQATFACKLQGATLAAITSPEELAVVSAHLQGAIWIGGEDSSPPGTYTWIDGEPWVFAPWKPGEPGGVMNKSCIKLAGPMPYGFAEDDCTQNFPFLCERSPAGKLLP